VNLLSSSIFIIGLLQLMQISKEAYVIILPVCVKCRLSSPGWIIFLQISHLLIIICWLYHS